MFAKNIKIFALIVVVVTVIFSMVYQFTAVPAILSLAITFGTISYHFVMRLAVGYLINGIFHNKMDYRRKWFQEKRFEKRLYQVLNVKKWKKKMPTFSPEWMNPKVHTWEEIAGAMCQAEVVHLITIVLCFVPIFATLMWGSFPVFLITSLLSAGVESMFVMMQRYNRPRVIKMIGREYIQEKITLCGDNCMDCPRYNAHDEEELRKVAELWYRVGWRDHIVSNDEIRCEGCSSGKTCTYQLVECTKAHSVDKCNHCAEYPCEKISNMLERSKAYQKHCKEVCSDAEYEMLKKAFFSKESNLRK